MQHYLWRNGKQIPIEKEPEFFTAILPNQEVLNNVANLKEVREVKKVFHNIYKVRASVYEREELMERMRTNDRINSFVHYAYNPVGDLNTRYYVTDRLVVSFNDGVSTSKKEEILSKHGLRYIKVFNLPNQPILAQCSKLEDKPADPLATSNELMELPEVRYAEPNLINRFAQSYTPSDTLYRNQWHLNAEDGIEVIKESDVSAELAWDLTRGSRNIVVGVLDDGFDITHPDFNAPGKIVFAKDFVDFDSSPFPTREKGDYHGTPCAGVAIGEENGQGIVGIAPGSSFMPIRFDLAADDNMLFEIFDYAGKRADVLSCSWGPVPVFAPLSSLLFDQMTELVERGGPRGKGVVVVFAAGNYNAPINDPDNTSFVWRHPSRGLVETRGAILNGHASHPGVIAVSASTSQNRKSAYSNWGNDISVCAPSDNWNPVDPNMRMPGRGIWTTDNETAGFGFEPGSRYTGQFGGTSSATPLVAGVAALVLDANPNLTAKQVKEILQTTADKIEDNNPDPVLGLTKGTYDGNGHSEWFGFGKVNAFKAVQKAFAMRGEIPDSGGDDGPDTNDSIVEGVYIVAALPNPNGRDAGREQVAIINVRNEDVNLDGWMIKDERGRANRIENVTLAPGETTTVTLTEARLLNSGGEIILHNRQDLIADKVSYESSDASNVGWWVKF